MRSTPKITKMIAGPIFTVRSGSRAPSCLMPGQRSYSPAVRAPGPGFITQRVDHPANELLPFADTHTNRIRTGQSPHRLLEM